jgi:hypothetical protein
MRERPYEAEALLQTLIAEHPEVLTGDEENGTAGWLLVKRETGVPDQADGADRWSLDHLFLDQAGILTLVEVKRSSDSRARREVVAQMLDYAANATAHWKVDSLRAWFESECDRADVDPVARVRDEFALVDYDAYWETVKTNLAADRIRLVFVADEISSELRSIVEFLNRQMTETEVLAIEVKQYVDDKGERQTIVPRILGQSEAARATKRGASGTARMWDEDSFLADLIDRRGEAIAAVARSLVDWAEEQEGVRIVYGRGAIYGSVQARLERDGRILLRSFRIYSNGKAEIPLRKMQSAEASAALRRRLTQAVPSISQGPVPSFDIDALEDEATKLRFLDATSWAFDEARRSS